MWLIPGNVGRGSVSMVGFFVLYWYRYSVSNNSNGTYIKHDFTKCMITCYLFPTSDSNLFKYYNMLNIG